MSTPVLDKIGQEIQEGSYIAYGHALGRCAGIRIGKVVAVKVTTRKGSDIVKRAEFNEDGSLKSPAEWGETDIYEYRITVQGVDDDWSHRTLDLCRKGTLQFPSRIIVLEESKVPAEFLKLLNQA